MSSSNETTAQAVKSFLTIPKQDNPIFKLAHVSTGVSAALTSFNAASTNGLAVPAAVATVGLGVFSIAYASYLNRCN